MFRTKIVIDIITGAQKVIPYTAEEEASADAALNVLPSLEDYRVAIQTFVDDTARDKMFNDGVALASYADDPFEPWSAQAKAFIAWRSGLWRYVYGEQEKFVAGERTQPSVADFLLELPEIVWP